MPNDPLNLNDPSHMHHAMGLGLAQKAQMEQQRRQAMAQALAGPQASPMAPVGSAMQAPAAMGAAPAYSGQGMGQLTQIAQAMGQSPYSQKFGQGGADYSWLTGASGGAKAPAALPEFSGTYGGMAKG